MMERYWSNEALVDETLNRLREAGHFGNEIAADVMTMPFADAELARLALHAENEAVQVAACKELLDRAIGKAVQSHTGEGGEGPVIVQVITGVPRATEQGF
jgi:hypothetical protein